MMINFGTETIIDWEDGWIGGSPEIEGHRDGPFDWSMIDDVDFGV